MIPMKDLLSISCRIRSRKMPNVHRRTGESENPTEGQRPAESEVSSWRKAGRLMTEG